MDTTLMCIISPAKHKLEGMKAAARYQAGDIVDTFMSSKYAKLQPDGTYQMQSQMGQPKFAFIHIKNIPDNVNKQKIKTVLTSELTLLGETVRKRRWHIPPSILPTAFKQKLFSTREITVDYVVAKNYIRKKSAPVLLDATKDDISMSLDSKDIS